METQIKVNNWTVSKIRETEIKISNGVICCYAYISNDNKKIFIVLKRYKKGLYNLLKNIS